MSITAVLAAVTCHSAYGQLDGINTPAQGAAAQIESGIDSAATPVQSPSGGIQANAATNTQAAGDVGANTGVGANANTGVDANANPDANAGVSGVDGQADANASSSDLNTTGQAGANASTQNQMNRGDRNLNRGVNRGIGVIGGIVPPIPQQALAGNSGPYDARWRFAQRNGQWWYYSPQNQWMVRQNDEWQAYNDSDRPLAGGNVDQGVYRSGFRGNVSDQRQYSNQQPAQGQNGYQNQNGQPKPGQTQMTAHTGPVYRLQFDQSGQEFICVRGQRVYFDDQQSIPNDQGGDETYESGRPNLDAADSEDQRPMTEPRYDGENAIGTTATQPPPAPTTDSPDSGSTTDNGSDADNDSEEPQQSKDNDPENQSDANRSNIDDNESE